MCSIRVGGLLLVAGLAFVGPTSSAEAQTTAELTRRFTALQHSADSAVQVYAEYMKRVGAARVYPDTVDMVDGNVKLITMDDLLPLVRAAGARAESEIRATLGTASSLARGTVISIRKDSVWTSSQGGDWVAVAEYSRKTGDALGGQVPADAPAIAQSIKTKVVRRIVEAGSRTFAQWRNGPLELNAITATDWAQLRFELVASRTTVAPKCYAGDMEACALTLGFRQMDDPIVQLYDSAARQRLVSSWSYRHDPSNARCSAGSDSACIGVLHRAGDWVAQAPSSAKMREVFANHALAIGGAGALQRMIASRGSIDEAFAAAAGMPFDSLLARWHRNVRQQGIASDNFTPVIGALSLGWILVLGGLSTRSSRWR